MPVNMPTVVSEGVQLAELSERLVQWRKTFHLENGRNPTKEEIPQEQRKLLRELTNLRNEANARIGGIELSKERRGRQRNREIQPESDSDSHVSKSPVREECRKNVVPRRSEGKLPGAPLVKLCPKKRKPRERTSASVAKSEANEGVRAEGEKKLEEEGGSCLGNLFTQVVDILEDAPKVSSQKSAKRAAYPRNYTRPKTKRNNLYRKRFRGSGGYSSKGQKVTTSNFCQVSRTGRNSKNKGGRSAPTGGKKRKNEYVPFTALFDGDVAPESNQNVQAAVREAETDCDNILDTAMRSIEFGHALRNSTESEVVREHLKDIFGFAGLRDGQLRIIKRILEGKSTLAIMPTGHGKSLLYQIPALVLETKAPIIVVSPLLALMKDQMSKLPKVIKHGILCSGQPSSEAFDTLDKIRSNKIKVVFISPERLYSKVFIKAFQSIGEAPPFVCIDEAHCISEWGNNFRPAYYRLGRILREELRVETVLALTATATMKAISSICNVLNLESSSVIKEKSVRSNLHLHVSELNRDTFKETVLGLLQPGGCLESKRSVIIYCNFQLEAELVAAHLYTHGILAKAYHGKMSMPDRNHVQDMFCKGKIRVVAATTAFGMGLDKKDVDAVIHSEMPRSVEEYVQQIGRAGRDGRDASCHMYFSEKGYRRLRSYCHSDEIDESSIHSLLCKMFSGRTIEGLEGGNAIGVLPLREISIELDVKESTIETILTFLEDMKADGSAEKGDEAAGGAIIRLLQPLLGHVYDFVFFETSESMADKFPLMKHIENASRGKTLRGGHYTIEISKLAKESKMTLVEIQDSIRMMQKMRVAECRLKDPALCYEIRHVPQNKRSLAQRISSRLREISKEGTYRLDYLYRVITLSNKDSGEDKNDGDQFLKTGIQRYFDENSDEYYQSLESSVQKDTVPNNKFISRDIRVFIQGNKHLLQRQKVAPLLTGRAIARIMQGISSPAYPASTWARNTMWERYMDTDFEFLLKAANREMIWYLTNKAQTQQNVVK